MTLLSPLAVPDTGGEFLKVDFIADAYSQLRISGLTVNPSPEDLEVALMRLEDMAAELHGRNVVTGYNFEDTPDPNSVTNIIRAYKSAFVTNLAIRLTPDFNKDAHPILFSQASQSMSNMCGRIALERLQQVQYPTRQARGSGNTLRYNRWARFYRQYNVGATNAAGKTMFVGDIQDFTEHFDSYLNSGEDIDSYTIDSDPALMLVSDSNDTPDISYRIQADEPTSATSSDGQFVTITITTTSGRVNTRQIFFELVQRANNV